MKLRTGDILIWRSTGCYDLISESLICLRGLHTGIILKGKIFAQLSVCGESPTNTYVTFLVDRIFPIEEVLGHIWHRPNGCSLHIIKRIGGRRVSSKEAFDLFNEFVKMKKRPASHTVYYACTAYLKVGGLIPETGHKNKRFHICPSLIAWFLDKFGFLHKKAKLNNLLPIDFYQCRFYQIEKYKRVTVFDKGTGEWNWFLTIPLIQWGVVKPKPIRCLKIEEMLGHYDYPRTILKDKIAKKQLRTYLFNT